MNVSHKQYWVTGPPAGITESLIASGLLSKDTEISKKQRDVKVRKIRRSSTSPPVIVQNKVTRPTTSLTVVKRFGQDILQPLTHYKPSPLTESTQVNHPFSLPPESKTLSDSKTPQDEQSFSYFERSINQKRVFTGKKESHELLTSFEQKLKEINSTDEQHVEEQNEAMNKMISVYTMAWNELILQLRCTNDDHAILSQKIKAFFLSLLKQIPTISNKYQERIADLLEEITANEATISKKDESISELTSEIEELEKTNQAKVSQIKALEKVIQEKKDEMEEFNYQKDLSNMNIKDLQYKITKLEEDKEKQKSEIDAQVAINTSLSQQIKSQEALISKYEKEGAGFRPKFLEATEEIQRMKIAYQNLETEYNEIKHKSMSDASTEPIKELEEAYLQAHAITVTEKKKGKRKRALSKSSSSMSFAVSVSTAQTSEEAPKQQELPMPAPVVEIPIEETPPQVIEEPVKEEKPPEEPAKPERIIIPVVDSAVEFVYKLFANQPDEYSPTTTASLFNTNTAVEEIRPLHWVLHKIVDIFQFSFNTTSEFHFQDIVHQCLLSQHFDEKLTDRIEMNLLHSILYYKLRSGTCQFFLEFMMNDLSMVQFKFFNILFTISFDYITPKVQTVIDDADIQTDSSIFQIHFDAASQIMKMLLSEELDKSVGTGLISFWKFARVACQVFKEKHGVFQTQIKTILSIISSIDTESISYPKFYEFFRFVLPGKSKSEIKNYFKSFCLESPEMLVHYIPKFCGNSPDITEAILNLPRTKEFKKSFSALCVPAQELYYFLKQRYTDYIPSLMESIPQDYGASLWQTIVQMRNSFIRCDVSSSYGSYQSILLYVDFRKSKDYPFCVIKNTITSDEIQELIDIIKLREKISSITYDKLS